MEGAVLARRERIVLLVALAGVTALAWLYLARLAHGATSHGPSSLPEAALAFAMWWVMMTGMMLPSVMPMTLTFATVNRRRRERGNPYVPMAVFVAGYLLAWGAFSLIATAAQWALERAALMTPAMRLASPLLDGLLFVAVGVYQLTPLKHACLHRCRSPLAFVLERWQDGVGGALRMGAEHGAHCVGCCAFLMVLLFAGGLMNLVWVAAIAAFVLLEKLAPAGEAVARASGLLAVGVGVWMIGRAIL